MPETRKERVERRKHKRFQAPKGVFIELGPHDAQVGRLRNISMVGLAFRYLGIAVPVSGSYVDIFMTESDFYLSRLPIKIISDVEILDETPTVSTTTRRCCAKFRKLTAYQSGRLKYFIENHTIGDA